jgi:hypothetical protein
MPFFPTGANIKLVVNGLTVAFATDFRYSIKVRHQNVAICGVYEGDEHEVLAYDVDGGFTIIRYVEGVKSKLERQRRKAPNGASDLGNGIGSWTKNQPNGPLGTLKNSGNFTNDGRANEALNPGLFQNGTWFDIELFQKLPNGQTGIARIKSCRIEQVDGQITKRGVFVQSFRFVANIVDEDSFLANESGVGQTTA